jgi:hypothetical protein
MFTYVAHTIAGYGAHIGDDQGPIASSGMYYSTPDPADRDAKEWAAYEMCKYEPFNFEKYYNESNGRNKS